MLQDLIPNPSNVRLRLFSFIWHAKHKEVYFLQQVWAILWK